MGLPLNRKIVTKVIGEPKFYKGCNGGEVQQWWEVEVEYYCDKKRASTTLISYSEEGAKQVKEGYIFYQ